MKPTRRSALAIAATFGAVALAPVVQAAATDTSQPGGAAAGEGGIDGACATPSSTTTSTVPATIPTTVPATVPTTVPATTVAGSGEVPVEPVTETPTTQPVAPTTPAPTVAPPSATVPSPVASVPTESVPTESVPTEPCEPGATTTTVPGETTTTLPLFTSPVAPTTTPGVTLPGQVVAPAVEIPAINAPATPASPLPERESAAPIEATGTATPSQPAVQATTPVEPTAPLPPVNLTWSGAGVPRLSPPRAPGTTSLQLGRTPAGERVVLVDDVEVILATIRQLESAGRYDIGPNRARASGAYQFIPSTWNNYGGYAEAYLAPPAVQDERARADVLRFLTMYGGDVSMVPIMWYYPRAALDPSWMDRVPNPAGGNRLTIREYQTRWLERLASNATELLGTYVAAPTSPAAVTVLSSIPVHEPVVAGDLAVAAGATVVAAPTTTIPATTTPPTTVPAVPAPATPAPATPVAAALGGAMTAAPATTVPAPPIDVDVVTVSDSTMDLAARSVPPAIEVDDGLGSMRTIVFPVLGPVAYADGWGDSRSGGRLHEGTDIVGVRMQPILAVVDGVISRYQPTSTGIRGVAITVADEDGWRYNYFHNNDDTPGTDDGQASEEFRLAPGLAIGDPVVAGQIIGYMGDSGNAEESVAHLHFELRDPTGRARPSYWSLRAAEARQACTIGIGPWSTPTLAGEDVTATAGTVDVAAVGPTAPADPAADPGVVDPAAATDPAAVVADPIVEHTVVTPMFGEGQWVIDSEGRVTATGDAALIMPRRDLQCDVGPATPFGTDSAGWDEVAAGALDGTVLAEADLTDTILDDVVPEAIVESLLPLAARVTSKVPTPDLTIPAVPPTDVTAPAQQSDAGPVVDAANTVAAVIGPAPAAGTVVVDGGQVTVDGESVVDDPISEPMMFTDPATGETIIVVFELPAPPPDFRLERLR